MKPVSHHSMLRLIVISCSKVIFPAGCFVVLLISWADNSVYANQVKGNDITGLTGIYLLFVGQDDLKIKSTDRENMEVEIRDKPDHASKATDIIKLRILVKRSAFNDGIR